MIADDRRSVFPYDRRQSQNFLRSVSHDLRSSVIIWKPAFILLLLLLLILLLFIIVIIISTELLALCDWGWVWWVGLVAGLRVGQAFGVLLLPGFGVGSSSLRVAVPTPPRKNGREGTSTKS